MPDGELSREEGAARGQHVSNILLVNLVAELRAMGGDELAVEVLARAGEDRVIGDRGTIEEGAFLLGWSSLDEAAAVFNAAIEVTGDPDVCFRAGQWAFRGTVSAGLVDGLRALGGPSDLFGLIGPVSAKVSTVTDAEPVEVGENHAVIRQRTRPPHVRNRALCDYSRGTLSSFPTVYDMAPADVTEVACQTRGDPHCEFHVRWDPNVADDLDAQAKIAALEERLETLSVRFANLEQVSALLSASNDVASVLAAVVRMAGVAVSAPHHMLAVRMPGDRSPRVQSVGVPPERAAALAEALLAASPGAGHVEGWDGPVMAVDVASARRHYGRLAAFYAEGHQFLPNEDRLLAAYAGHAAAALEAAAGFEETRLLLHFSARLAEIAATSEMTARIAGAPLWVVASPRSAVLLWEASDSLLVRSAVASWPADGTGGDVEDGTVAGDTPVAAAVDGEALSAWAEASANRPRPAWNDPLLAPLQEVAGCRHAVAVPLVARHQFLGVLMLETAESDDGIDPDVGERLAAVANLAASALHSARLLEVVQHQAHHDTLTGLPNMRLFEDRMSMALATARRSGEGLALLFVDLDGFKDVNDRLGHAAGDRVLRDVAGRLRQAARESDSVARLGGDEFVVLVPSVGGAVEAEGVRDRIAAAVESTPVVAGSEEIHLRASIGIARYPEDGDDPATLLQQADLSMYRSKVARSSADA